MTQNIADNPANRLLLILQECKAIHGTENCRVAWQRVLKTNDEGELLARIAKILNLSQDTVELIGETFPRHLPAVQQLHKQLYAGVTRQVMGGQWEAFISQISNDSVVSINFAASLLDEREKFRTVDGEELTVQRDKLIELRKEVVESKELPEDVRVAIARYLGRLIDSLDEYFITGVFPVLDAASAAIGNIAFDRAYGNALRDTDLGQKVASALANVANSVTIVTGMLQLAEPLRHILAMLPPH